MAISGIGQTRNSYYMNLPQTNENITETQGYGAVSRSIAFRAAEALEEEAQKAAAQEDADDGGILSDFGQQASGEELTVRGSRLKAHLNGEDKKVPYGFLAQDGVIEYNGVTFVCNEQYGRLELGDTSVRENCIIIPLSEGGSLMVNRDSIGDLGKAIGMFSPEDVNRIMRAIHQDNKARQVLAEIEDEENSVGKGTAADEESAEACEENSSLTEEKDEAPETAVLREQREEKEKH